MNDMTFMLLTIYRTQLTLNYAKRSLPQSKIFQCGKYLVAYVLNESYYKLCKCKTLGYTGLFSLHIERPS